MTQAERDETKLKLQQNLAHQRQAEAHLAALKVEEHAILLQLADEVERLRDEWEATRKAAPTAST